MSKRLPALLVALSPLQLTWIERITGACRSLRGIRVRAWRIRSHWHMLCLVLSVVHTSIGPTYRYAHQILRMRESLQSYF